MESRKGMRNETQRILSINMKFKEYAKVVWPYWLMVVLFYAIISWHAVTTH